MTEISVDRYERKRIYFPKWMPLLQIHFLFSVFKYRSSRLEGMIGSI